MNPAVWVVHPPRAEADALAEALGIPRPWPGSSSTARS